jgi:small nuclear ribonucleoprotein (snRNP)-like protein
MLQSLVNEEVIVRLKWGQTEYKGRLVSVDSYMNIQLTNTEEYIDQKQTGTLGQVLIRYARGRREWWAVIGLADRLTDVITCCGYKGRKGRRVEEAEM